MLPAWVWDHSHRQPTNGHILRENGSFSYTSQQLSTSPQLGIEPCDPLPHPGWSFAGLLFCRPCVGNHSWYEFVSAMSCHVQKATFHSIPCCSLALVFSLLILCYVPWALEWGSWYGELSLLLAFWPIMSLHWLLSTVSLAKVKSTTNLWL